MSEIHYTLKICRKSCKLKIVRKNFFQLKLIKKVFRRIQFQWKLSALLLDPPSQSVIWASFLHLSINIKCKYKYSKHQLQIQNTNKQVKIQKMSEYVPGILRFENMRFDLNWAALILWIWVWVHCKCICVCICWDLSRAKTVDLNMSSVQMYLYL